MSPFPTTKIARRLAEHAGVPWVADLRDPWALDEMMTYPSGLHRILETKRMYRELASAAAIIMNTPDANSTLLSNFPELKRKLVTTITNGYDSQDFEGEAPARTDGKFRIVHTGYLHTEGGLKLRRRQRFHELMGGLDGGIDILTRSHVILLQAIERWISRTPEVEQSLELVFAGVTSESDKSAVLNSSLASFIRFPGYLSHVDSVSLVRTADVLFLPMHNLSAGRRSRIVPGKTYEYMAAGRPILAAVPEGDARDFLEKAGTAIIVNPDDVTGMTDALNRLYESWKCGSAVSGWNRKFVKRFERTNLTKQLAAVFNSVLANSKPGA